MRGAGVESRQDLAVEGVDRAVTLADDWTRELAAADVVLIAAPVAQYPALLRAMAGRLGPATLVTDAGSTKQDVIAAARDALGADMTSEVSSRPDAATACRPSTQNRVVLLGSSSMCGASTGMP